ncbi:MAG: hydroxyquinol 1,2-dioxygenase [Burkholderiaceae bacterium]|nr:hydroxyquinol 1,2-dioxygenase [Rhodoferax sp.]MCP5283614.1 hydroxyquinol 1,2-dioxygenase [Burkholderiaceae bacterium]
MRNIDEHNITDAVIARLGDGRDARLTEVMTALIRHLHGFVREVRLTEREWEQAIGFLTATGQQCDARRQEFILLSDVLGVSMLTVTMNQSRPEGATEATVFGPFHVDDAPHCASGADIAQGAPGTPLDVHLEVVDLQGRPVVGAEVDTWQADEEGLYDVQRPELGDTRRARGVFLTDAKGQVRFSSVLPMPYPVPTDGPVGQLLLATGRHPWRPAHIHFRIRAPGFAPLITHLFHEGDAYLDSDVVFGVRSSLVAEFERVGHGDAARHRLRHRFVLAPAQAPGSDLPA